MQKLDHIRNVIGLFFHTLVFIASDVNYRLKFSFRMVNAVFTVQQANIGKGVYSILMPTTWVTFLKIVCGITFILNIPL